MEPARRLHIRTQEFEQAQAFTEYAFGDVRFEPLSQNRRFDWDAKSLDLGPIQVVSSKLDSGVRLRGQTTNTTISLGHVGNPRAADRDDKAIVVRNRSAAIYSPHHGTDWRCEGEFSNTSVVIARSYLQQQLELITGIRVDRPIEFAFAISTEAGLGLGLERLCQFLAEQSDGVASLEHPLVAASMCETLARMLILGQRHDHGHLLEQRQANIGAREQRLLEEYIVANAGGPIGLAELAGLTGANGQVIEASFRDRRGLPLQAFIERSRLEHIREQLQTSPELTPARARRRANITFAEHFDAEYLRAFGELPDATWLRAQTKKVSPITSPATVFLIVGDAQLAQTMQSAVREGGYPLERFDSVDAFIRAEHSERLGCVVVELALAGHRRLAEACPLLPRIGLSAGDTARVAIESMKDGALDVLVTPVETNALWQGIELAFAHGAAQRRAHMIQAQQADRLASLTPREREVCERVARGSLNKQIAADLQISVATVKVHRARGLQKLGASSVAELARLLTLG